MHEREVKATVLELLRSVRHEVGAELTAEVSSSPDGASHYIVVSSVFCGAQSGFVFHEDESESDREPRESLRQMVAQAVSGVFGLALDSAMKKSQEGVA